MQALEKAFPRRPILVKNAGLSGGAVLSFAVLVCLALGVFILWSQGPGIMRDYKISQNPVVDENATLSNGTCKTRQLIMTNCKADITFTDGAEKKQSVDFMFIDMNRSGYDVEVVRSGDDPSLVTLDLGVEKLWDRIFTISLFAVFLIGGSIAAVFAMLKTRKLNRLMQKPLVLKAMPVTVTAIQKNYGIRNVFYSFTNAAGKKKKRASRFKKKEEPFYLKPELATGKSNEMQALAVLPEGWELPVILDHDLNRLDLTAEEKATIRTALSV